MRKNQGITLIALIITIIVMLILVGVVVTVVIQSDLLGTAKNAGDEYKAAYEKESGISGVTINGKEYGSIEEYMEKINPIIVEPENIDDWIYVLEDDGTITINGYKGSDKEVVIPNYINGVPVKKIGRHQNKIGFQKFWEDSICDGRLVNFGGKGQKLQNTIKTVIISQGIEIIDAGEFSASESLKEIYIPSSVKTVGEHIYGDYTEGLITVKVFWKEGEKPEGWDDNWAGGNVVIDYAK